MRAIWRVSDSQVGLNQKWLLGSLVVVLQRLMDGNNAFSLEYRFRREVKSRFPYLRHILARDLFDACGVI